MKSKLFSWLLSVVFSLVFVASVSHADILAIRCILGLPDDVVSAQTPVAQFAIDRPYDIRRPFSTDELVGNSANDSFVLLPTAADQILEPFSSLGELTVLLVILPRGNSCQNNLVTGIVPAALPQSASGLSKDRTTTIIMLDIMLPTSIPPQIHQDRAAGESVQLISPSPVRFSCHRGPVSLQGHNRPIEISHARGPVK
jgi:hypothetical protein